MEDLLAIPELRSIGFPGASSRIDLCYFGHVPGPRNGFNARSYPLESSFMLVP
jgi:hypothetical protein